MYSKYVDKKVIRIKIFEFLDSTILDVCSKGSITSSNGLSLISPMFPNEYPNNINCTCSIESSKEKSIVIIDVEVKFQFYLFK
jgi:hypothetical protein